jgi:hypothetical protein
MSLWERLAHLLDPDHQWVLGCDYNMTILACDQKGGSPHDLPGRDASAWSLLSLSLGLSGYPPASSNVLSFTWDNKCYNTTVFTGPQILKRLDRFHVLTSFTLVCPTAWTIIHATQLLLDHCPISLHLSPAPCSKHVPFRMNSRHLFSPLLQEIVWESWALSLSESVGSESNATLALFVTSHRSCLQLEPPQNSSR